MASVAAGVALAGAAWAYAAAGQQVYFAGNVVHEDGAAGCVREGVVPDWVAVA